MSTSLLLGLRRGAEQAWVTCFGCLQHAQPDKSQGLPSQCAVVSISMTTHIDLQGARQAGCRQGSHL